MPYADPLTDADANAALAQLDGWEREGATIRRTIRCADFRAAIALVDAVADAAESADHHPDISIHGYRRVTFVLTTHAAKALTRRDIELATEIDRIARSAAEAGG
jgi:4a-hydroxytetrahydrobiopterin dehydratase